MYVCVCLCVGGGLLRVQKSDGLGEEAVAESGCCALEATEPLTRDA